MAGLEKAPLEMTLEDHRAVGSTPSQVLVANPGKTRAETMNHNELYRFLKEEVESVTETHEAARRGEQWALKALPLGRDKYLGRNIPYLRSIGRLPAEFDFDPAIRFALSKK